MYVNDEDLERAKAVLVEASGFSDDELAALSEQALEDAIDSPSQDKGIDHS
jgi:hypothetical protein